MILLTSKGILQIKINHFIILEKLNLEKITNETSIFNVLALTSDQYVEENDQQEYKQVNMMEKRIGQKYFKKSQPIIHPRETNSNQESLQEPYVNQSEMIKYVPCPCDCNKMKIIYLFVNQSAEMRIFYFKTESVHLLFILCLISLPLPVFLFCF